MKFKWKKVWEKEWETNYPGPEQSVINHQRAFLAGWIAANEEHKKLDEAIRRYEEASDAIPLMNVINER